MSRNRLRVGFVTSIAAALACASPAPPVTEYLLRDDAPTGQSVVATASDLSLGTVGVAAYLRRPGIVVEIAPGQLRAANGHRWAEPLSDGVRAVLRAELSRAVGFTVGSDGRPAGPETIRIDLAVGRLHGTLDGSAVLEADYRIAGGGRTTEHHFVASETVPADGYPALVEAQRRLIRRIAEAIAGSLEETDP